LGRRPWFALLRRARNLRRFALAMVGRIPAMGAAPIPGGLLTVSAPGWSHGPVLAATTMRQRWIGLGPLPLGWGLLVAGRSVHGRGMREALTVVGLDAGGAVTGAIRLVPGGRVTMAGAVAILELPVGVTVPDTGRVLTWEAVGSSSGASYTRSHVSQHH
jgi:hypothetical protein